jgi:UPF0755 protein
MEDTAPDEHDGQTLEPQEQGGIRARFFGRSQKKEMASLEPSPPPPRRKRRPTLSALSGLLSFLLLLSVGGLFGVIWGAQRLHQPGPLTADKVLYIAPGTDYPDIVSQLESEGVIDNPWVFNAAVMASGKRSKIKAGEYLFKQGASMRDVIAILVNGRQVLHSITIPEGLTSEEVVARLQQSDILLGEVHEMPKEGTLLPETYKVPRGMSRSDVVRRMQEDQKKLVEQIWAHRAPDLVLRSPYELVTLASIVEKETGKTEERPHVAAVFLNRLQKHMRLQSDPTIVYGLVGGKGTLGRPILKSEVERATPYNTYIIDGLPPGPIANPGRAALEAVANPAHSADLYFVADGTGGHVFAATLEQHMKNVQHWRQIQKEAKEKSDVDHVAPQAPIMGPVRPHQHSDLDDGTVFGALSNSFGASDDVGPTTLGLGSAAAQLANVAPRLPGANATAKPTSAGGLNPAELAQSQSKAANLNIGPGLDQLGISVQGVNDAHSAAALLDGPIDTGAPAPQTNGQVAAAFQSQQQPQQSDQPKPDQMSADPTGVASANDTTASAAIVMPGAAAPQPQQTGKPVHVVAFDASEGTALDPLRNKTYDLNYAKTVPSATAVQ